MKIRRILVIMVLLVLGSLVVGGFLYYSKLRESGIKEAHEDVERGTHRLIGETLMNMDIMNAAQLTEVIKALFRKGAASNVAPL